MITIEEDFLSEQPTSIAHQHCYVKRLKHMNVEDLQVQ